MYTIYADDSLIYSPDVEDMCLYDIVLTLEDNSAGTLNFNITSDHFAFGRLQKLATRIAVRDSERIIWKGRIVADDSNIDNIKTIQCEGQLAFLNDSIFPAFDFSGSPEELFRDIIENHNELVNEKQRLKVGRVTVKDKNDYIVRSSKNDLKTWKAVKEKCFQSTLGGHVRIRYEEDGDYIDWLEDYEEISGQPISFGKNIIDLLVNTSATEMYTAIRPMGAVVNNQRITIASVNDGEKYIVDQEKAEEYGIIFADPDDSIWEDVTLPQNLLRKAKERLKAGTSLKKTINVQAIDLNLTDAQIEALYVCTYVKVESALHDIGAWYLLSKAEIHIDAPENTRYTLGAVRATLTDTSKQSQGVIQKTMDAAIPTDVSQLRNDINYTTEAEVRNIINTSGTSAPVITVGTETEETYILHIKTAADEFDTPNLHGRAGRTAYQEAVKAGFVGTEVEWLDSLKGAPGIPGTAGGSAYEIAVKNGYEGTEAEWLDTLKGDPGTPGTAGGSAYEIAVKNGYEGTEAEWLDSLKGDPGTPGAAGGSAYEIAVKNGYEGTEAEWLDTLKGVPGTPGAAGGSAYEIAVKNGYEGTEAEWLDTLKGVPGTPGAAGGSAYEIAVKNGYEGTEAEWLDTLKGEPGKDGTVSLDGIEGTEGDILQFKNGKWNAAQMKVGDENPEILFTIKDITTNETVGKLVDALVIKEVFQSVSDGKSKIALAITDKGVDTSATDTFLQMAANIGMIQGGGSGAEGLCVKRIINISMSASEGCQIMPLTCMGAGGDIIMKPFAKADISVTERSV